MKKAMIVLGMLALFSCVSLPAVAQNKSLENAVTRTVVAGQSIQATKDLQRTIVYMTGVLIPQERDGVLRMATQAIKAGADVRAEFVFADGTHLTVLESIVEAAQNHNPAYFAELYNLVVAKGANPKQDLHGTYIVQARQLPLEQNQSWQKIADTTLDPIVTPQPQTAPQYTYFRPVTIHIPEEYNQYSCRKLSKLQKEGTLPKATVTYGDTVKVKAPKEKTYKSDQVLTITIPEEYNKYSCRKLAKMQKEGTLPKTQLSYSTK